MRVQYLRMYVVLSVRVWTAFSGIDVLQTSEVSLGDDYFKMSAQSRQCGRRHEDWGEGLAMHVEQ